MPEVSRPWENKRAGLQKVGEQKKCYGFQQQNNGSGREGSKEAKRHGEKVDILLFTHQNQKWIATLIFIK